MKHCNHIFKSIWCLIASQFVNCFARSKETNDKIGGGLFTPLSNSLSPKSTYISDPATLVSAVDVGSAEGRLRFA